MKVNSAVKAQTVMIGVALMGATLLGWQGASGGPSSVVHAEDKPAEVVKTPPRNWFLAADKYATTHFDPAQTDVMPYPAPRGIFHVDPENAPRVWHGPIHTMTAASTSPDYMWGFSSEGVTYIDVRNGGFGEVARASAPGVGVLAPEALQKVLHRKLFDIRHLEHAVFRQWQLDEKRIGNGVYAIVDRDNLAYYGTLSGQVFVFGLNDPHQPAQGIRLVLSRDFKQGLLGENEAIAGMSMTYDGKLVVVGNHSLSIVNRDLTDVSTMRFGADERVTNGVAIDERNGIYVASDKLMRKVVWTGARLSDAEQDGAWSAPYDRGRQPSRIKLGTGTGSTPTLMGFEGDPDQLVVITDGSDYMKLVAFWREQIPANFKQLPNTKSRRIAGQIPVTCGGLKTDPEFIQTEQSVVAKNYGAFVVNNIAKNGEKDRLVDVFALGPIHYPARGVERFEWDPSSDSWRSVWARYNVVSMSMAPTMSGPSDIVFVNGYTKTDGWELTGLDWNNGQTVHRTLFGQSQLGNGAYGLIQFMPNGDLLFNSIGGPARIELMPVRLSEALPIPSSKRSPTYASEGTNMP